MKKTASMFVLLFFMLPSVSFAAALTSQQSSSLIAVVQSSPGTPASAFVSLITAFSNITTAQASSLITVVQSAPGVPANAFVNLLTSFTVDTPTTQPATPATNQAITPTTPSGTTPTTPATNQSATPSTVPASSVSVSFRSSPTEVPAGMSRAVLAVFNMLANENVKVTDLHICVINPTHNNGLANVSIAVNGVGLGISKRVADCDTTPAGTEFNYGSQITLAAEVTSSVTVYGRTDAPISTNDSNNKTVQIKLVGQGSKAYAVPSNDVLGGVVSVVDTTLTAVQEHSCPSIQSNLGTQSACLGSFKLYSTREEISINTITINMTAANASLITNLTLKDHVTGAALYHVSGTALAVKATPTTKNTYPVNFKVPTSGKTIDVYGNVPSNAGAIQLTLDSPTDGVGVLTGWSSSIASPVPLQTITIQQISTPALSCTQDTWSCSGWLGCSSSGSQIRTCDKTFDCSSVSTPSPTTSQSCTPPVIACTSFTYSAWGTCQSNSTQSRSLTSSSPSGCTGGSPSLSQSCTYTPTIQIPIPTYQQTNGPRFVSWTDSIGNTLDNNFDYYDRGAWEQHTVMSTPISISEHPTLTVTATANDPSGRPLQYHFESSNWNQGTPSYSSSNSFTFNVRGAPGTTFRAIVQIKNDDSYLSFSSGYDVDAEWFVDYPLIP